MAAAGVGVLAEDSSWPVARPAALAVGGGGGWRARLALQPKCARKRRRVEPGSLRPAALARHRVIGLARLALDSE